MTGLLLRMFIFNTYRCTHTQTREGGDGEEYFLKERVMLNVKGEFSGSKSNFKIYKTEPSPPPRNHLKGTTRFNPEGIYISG